MFDVLQTGATVTGLAGPQPVKLIAVERLTDDSANVAYRTDSGIVEKIVFADALTHVQPVSAGLAFTFDAGSDSFLLAAEARRMSLAHLFDPLAALGTSDVQPLPHQLRAVYGTMLNKQPLRFVLADDPGAGKTVMAGLLVKELLLRGDATNVMVVSPGVLVDQWDEEMQTKFGLEFEMLTRDKVVHEGNPFARGGLWLARLDVLARNSEGIFDKAAQVDWDLIIFDEAHKLSASVWGGEVKKTKRYQMAEELGKHTRNLLLMTATPHSGKEEQFQMFMALLDSDRFEGVVREGTRKVDVSDLMRRLVKEDLRTFEGKRLFPRRYASTVEYELSEPEKDLYTAVTDYVREEMNRVDEPNPDGRRRNAVGFALTTLQRRLASSPAAIHRSLERRRNRLKSELGEATMRAATISDDVDIPDWDDLDDLTDEELRALEEHAIAGATASRTPEELETEIAVLDQLIIKSTAVKASPTYAKWDALRDTLDDTGEMRDDTGARRKVIIFTEHKDTLDDLVARLTQHLGRDDAVVTIHGGTRREDRKKAKETFEQDEKCVFLIATDAAGEGVNLHRNAHLLINYDLPWNPNRIEQRFGRIHRIGQREVCHLWNMVAKDTREGDVFTRLLTKTAEMDRAYNGNLFNVLGDSDAFQEQSLRDLLIQAIRYGDRPETKAQLECIIDTSVAHGLDELVAERALHEEMFSTLDLEEVRARMEKARERRLQPGYIAAFFLSAFQRLGGRIRRREQHRYEITRVPQRLIGTARRLNRWSPVAERYERVTFEQSRIHPERQLAASLIAPGHPLLQAVIEATIDDLGEVLKRGTVLVDRRSNQAALPSLMFSVEQRIENPSEDSRPVSHHFDYPLLEQDETVNVPVAPPYLDFDRPAEDEAHQIAETLGSDWVRLNHDKSVRSWAYRHGLQPRLNELRIRLEAETARTRKQVEERLVAEINHWEREFMRLEALEREGTVGRLRAETARTRAHSLEARLSNRLKELDAATNLVAAPAVIRGSALIIPSNLLAAEEAGEPNTFARETEEVERRAVDSVLAAEKALGRRPVEMARNNPGYDIQSTDTSGRIHYIEVKGRIQGSETFTITTNEVTFAQTQGNRHRLALVEVSIDGPEQDQLRYVLDAFNHFEPAATTRSINENWQDYWTKGGAPQ